MKENSQQARKQSTIKVTQQARKQPTIKVTQQARKQPKSPPGHLILPVVYPGVCGNPILSFEFSVEIKRLMAFHQSELRECLVRSRLISDVIRQQSQWLLMQPLLWHHNSRCISVRNVSNSLMAATLLHPRAMSISWDIARCSWWAVH
jgi:hypothetical protein